MFSIRSIHDADAHFARKVADRARNPLPNFPNSTLHDMHEILSGGADSFGSEVSWYYGDISSHLELRLDDDVMQAGGYGPSHTAAQLRHALSKLNSGDGVYNTGFLDEHGLHLRFIRNGNIVTVERVHQGKRMADILTDEEAGVDPARMVGPPRLHVPWGDFVDGVNGYLRWHITEHVFEAPWLFHSPLIRQWRREAGLSTECPDHPETATADD